MSVCMFSLITRGKKEYEKSACLVIHHCVLLFHCLMLKMICYVIVLKLSHNLIIQRPQYICLSLADFPEEMLENIALFVLTPRPADIATLTRPMA